VTCTSTNKAIAKFFRISELEARKFLTDAEMAVWFLENLDRLSFGRAW
jgi:hypothetical protein